MNLYQDPVYRVIYKKLGREDMFSLKTLKGCMKRIEKEKLEVIKIERIQRHSVDETEIKVLERIKL